MILKNKNKLLNFVYNFSISKNNFFDIDPIYPGK